MGNDGKKNGSKKIKTWSDLFKGSALEVLLKDLSQIEENDLIEPVEEIGLGETVIGEMTFQEKVLFTWAVREKLALEEAFGSVKDDFQISDFDKKMFTDQIFCLSERVNLIRKMTWLFIASRFDRRSGYVFAARRGFKIVLSPKEAENKEDLEASEIITRGNNDFKVILYDIAPRA